MIKESVGLTLAHDGDEATFEQNVQTVFTQCGFEIHRVMPTLYTALTVSFNYFARILPIDKHQHRFINIVFELSSFSRFVKSFPLLYGTMVTHYSFNIKTSFDECLLQK